jgi:hypothetical protein
MTIHKEARAAIQQAAIIHQQDITKDRNVVTKGIGGPVSMRQHG